MTKGEFWVGESSERNSSVKYTIKLKIHLAIVTKILLKILKYIYSISNHIQLYAGYHSVGQHSTNHARIERLWSQQILITHTQRVSC